jgi:hypothetical protein
VLPQPIDNVIVLMPPDCTTAKQARKMVAGLAQSLAERKPGFQSRRNRAVMPVSQSGNVLLAEAFKQTLKCLRA